MCETLVENVTRACKPVVEEGDAAALSLLPEQHASSRLHV